MSKESINAPLAHYRDTITSNDDVVIDVIDDSMYMEDGKSLSNKIGGLKSRAGERIRRSRLSRPFLYLSMVYYCVMIVLTTATGIWEFLGVDIAWEFYTVLVLQLIIIVCLAAELCLKLIVQGRLFLKKKINYLDMFVLICCLCSFVASIINRFTNASDAVIEDMIFVALFVLRNFARILTMSFWIKEMYKKVEKSLPGGSEGFAQYYPQLIQNDEEQKEMKKNEKSPLIQKAKPAENAEGSPSINTESGESETGSPGMAIQPNAHQYDIGDLMDEYGNGIIGPSTSLNPQTYSMSYRMDGYHDDMDMVEGGY